MAKTETEWSFKYQLRNQASVQPGWMLSRHIIEMAIDARDINDIHREQNEDLRWCMTGIKSYFDMWCLYISLCFCVLTCSYKSARLIAFAYLDKERSLILGGVEIVLYWGGV